MFMKLSEIICNADNVEIDDDFVNQIENVYSCKLPENVKHILCIPENEENYDERLILQKLSNDMILEATEEMNSDFIGNHLIPLFDCGDNDYICYNYENGIWCMFNIVNDLVFNRNQTLLDLF